MGTLISQVTSPNSLQICPYLDGKTFKEPLKQGLMLTKSGICGQNFLPAREKMYKVRIETENTAIFPNFSEQINKILTFLRIDHMKQFYSEQI